MTDAIATDTGAAVLELLEQEGCVINMTGLVLLLADHPEPEIKRLTNDLYQQGKIHRVQIMGAKAKYYGYFALSVRTASHKAREQLSTDEALEVLERAGWHPEPEVIEPAAPPVERRTPDRRRLTVLEVVKRWRLTYPLGRVVEILAESRRGGTMSRDNAALAIKMIREYVRGDDA